MQVHEQHIVQSGAVTQEMAQCINALIQENQDKAMRIDSLTRESQAQTEVLLRHQMGQNAIAGVIKTTIACQQGQQQPQQTE